MYKHSRANVFKQLHSENTYTFSPMEKLLYTNTMENQT